MKSLANLALLSTGLVFALFACRGGGDDGDDAPNPDAPPGGTRIQDIQNDAMPVGTQVELRGVVVTAIDTFGNRTGDLWVQDPQGGPFSGIKVFNAPLDTVAALQAGDVVDITNAEKDEFALTSDTSGRKVTEIKPVGGGMMTITKQGTGTIPTPATVDAAAISMMPAAMQDAEWEKWEGVLINVINARQTGDVTTFGMNPGPDSKEFDITGGVAVQTVLADFPATAVADTCYQGITGIGDYFFNYLLLPRNSNDLVTGGTGCVATPTATIAEVQSGAKTGAVQINDVFVVAVSFNKCNLWVSQTMTAAANEGLYVFRGTGSTCSGQQQLGTDFVPGAKVKISGMTKEQNNDMTGDTLTQIQSATATFLTAPTGTVTPVSGQTVTPLTVSATGEPYESVLVTLTNVKVNTVGDNANFGVGQLQQGAQTFLSDDDVFRILAPEVGKCYASITGIWTYQVFDNVYGFLPLANGTGTGTCP